MRRRVIGREKPSGDEYLHVTPEVVWVTGDFSVSSNTDWIIR